MILIFKKGKEKDVDKMNLNILTELTDEIKFFSKFLKDFKPIGVVRSISFEEKEEAEKLFYKMNHEKFLNDFPLDVTLNEIHDKGKVTFVIDLEKRSFSTDVEAIMNKYRAKYEPKGDGLHYQMIEVLRIIELAKNDRFLIGLTDSDGNDKSSDYDLLLKAIQEKKEVEEVCDSLIKKFIE